MKSPHFITLLCIFAISLCFFSQSISSSASSTFYLGRRTFTEVPISSPNQENPQNSTQAIDDDKTKQSTVQDGSMTEKYATSTDEEFDEIVYHIDYHGVTTHPTPTPRHDRHPNNNP